MKTRYEVWYKLKSSSVWHQDVTHETLEKALAVCNHMTKKRGYEKAEIKEITETVIEVELK
jgi:hypothetical protein